MPSAEGEMTRRDGRSDTELRKVELVPGYLKHPAGSAMIHLGETRVLCTASVEERVPPFLSGKQEGWVTGEYAMIPAAASQRTMREIHRGRPSGRTVEIQRLIGRALRSVVDRRALGERTIWVDCEVLQADGGTRTASITGGFVAFCLALRKLREDGVLKAPVLTGLLAAVSVGVIGGRAVLDLDYPEDSAAEVDMNVARTDDGRYVEIQGTAESMAFSRDQLQGMLDCADRGIDVLQDLQRQTLGPGLDGLIIAR